MYCRIHTIPLHLSVLTTAYLIEECEALQCLVARSNKLINLLVKGLRDKPPHYSVTNESLMETEDDVEDDVTDERSVKLYPQSCEVYGTYTIA